MKENGLRENIKEQARQRYRQVRAPFFKLVFSRTFMTILVLALQVICIYVLLFRLSRYSAIANQLVAFISAIIIIVIYNNRTNESYKLSWTFLMAVIPIFGLYMYIVARTNLFERKIVGNLRTEIENTQDLVATRESVRFHLKSRDIQFRKLVSYIERIGGFAAFEDTDIKYYSLGDYAFDDMCDALEAAEDFIFMEYFIIQPGVFWDNILDILERKANEGVEVRVLYDGVGCMSTLPYNYYKKLEAKGIRCHSFSPLHPLFSTHYNNRDHRKILVIDGSTAFSGGINIADEYINEYERFGKWKDNAFRLTGDAVKSYTLMFLQMWNAGNHTDTNEGTKKYLISDLEHIPRRDSSGVFIPYGDGPYTAEVIAKNVYEDIIDGAFRHIDIMTPYFIPDRDLLHAIKHAAKSGIDVKIILPHIPDKKIIFMMTRSYYRELLRAGVHIYEYLPGFVHTKLVSADSRIAATGTVNLDFRSLYLHYECGCLIYDNPVINEIESDFVATLDECKEITAEDLDSRSVWTSICTYFLRIAAPLL